MTVVRRQGLLLVMLIAAVSVVALGSSVLPLSQIRDQRRDLDAAHGELLDLQQRGRELTARIQALNTPIEIERLARERLGYVRPGETAYVVMDPPTTPAAPAASQTAVPDTADIVPNPWYVKVWAFVTGADL